MHFKFDNIPYRRQHNWHNSNLKVQLNQHQSQYALLYRRKIRMAISCLSNSNPCQHTLVKSQDMKMINLFLTSGGSETKSVTSQPCNILHKSKVKKQPKQRSWLEILWKITPPPPVTMNASRSVGRPFCISSTILLWQNADSLRWLLVQLRYIFPSCPPTNALLS